MNNEERGIASRNEDDKEKREAATAAWSLCPKLPCLLSLLPLSLLLNQLSN